MAIISDIVPRLHSFARTDLASNLDHFSLTRPTIQIEHQFVHLGVHFFHAAVATLASSDILYHLMLTPPNGASRVECHLKWAVDHTLACTIEIIEGIVGTAPATIPFNSRRASGTVAEARVDSASAGYSGGTVLDTRLVGAATGPGSRIGGVSSREDELCLLPSTLYAVKITSEANGNRVTSHLDWYETGSNVFGV